VVDREAVDPEAGLGGRGLETAVRAWSTRRWGDETHHALAGAVLEVLADRLSDPLGLVEADEAAVVLAGDALGVLSGRHNRQQETL